MTQRTHRRHPRGDRSYCGIRNVPEDRLREHLGATTCKVCRYSYLPHPPKTWAERTKRLAQDRRSVEETG